MKNYCTFLFVDLLKAFNTFNQCILCQRLLEIGLSNQAAGWFSNDLSDHKQFITFKKNWKRDQWFLFQNRLCIFFHCRGKGCCYHLFTSPGLRWYNWHECLCPSCYLLESVYYKVLRVITGCKPLTHHCTLYSLVDWSSLALRRRFIGIIFIFKSLSGLLPSYLSEYMLSKQFSYSLWS